MPRLRKRLWLAFGFRVGRVLAGDRPPRYGRGGVLLPSVVQERLLLTRSGAGAPELRSLGHTNNRGGQAPARRFARPSPFLRRARACPSPCLGREGNGLCRRAFFARVVRARGPVPREYFFCLNQDLQDDRIYGMMGFWEGNVFGVAPASVVRERLLPKRIQRGCSCPTDARCGNVPHPQSACNRKKPVPSAQTF